MEKKLFYFFAIKPTGEMSHTATYHCTDKERQTYFADYQRRIEENGKFAGWMEVKPRKTK